MTYAEAKGQRDYLEALVSEASTALREFPGLANGLTPDHVRATPEYKQAKAQHATAFKDLRDFNQQFVRVFKREIKLDRLTQGAGTERR